jgi:hypothetical protein
LEIVNYIQTVHESNAIYLQISILYVDSSQIVFSINISLMESV